MAAPMRRTIFRSFSLFQRIYSAPQCMPRHLASTTPPVAQPPVPEWKQPDNETTELQRARLLYQSRKRGMTENGLLLSTFASRYLDAFNKKELNLYDTLINKPSNDWDLYYWIVGNQPTPDEYNNAMMDKLKEHSCNKDLESRIVQPSLPEREGREM